MRRAPGPTSLRWALLGAAVSILIGGLQTRSALGYARATTAAGAPHRWAASCVTFTVHLDAVPGVTEAEARSAARAAAEAWTAASIDCTGLLIDLVFPPGPGPADGNDRINTIGARADGWCEDPGSHSVPAPENSCGKDPSELASTSVLAIAESGEIVDADIQLNTVNFHWGHEGGHHPSGLGPDLQATLTHEIGHALGLNHPCWSGAGPRVLDDQGEPVPDCYDAPEEVQQSIMFPETEPGRVSNRTLSPEDMRAVCEIYPATAAPPACPAVLRAGGGGCSVAGGGGPLRSRPTPRGGMPPALVAIVVATLIGYRKNRHPPR